MTNEYDCWSQFSLNSSEDKALVYIFVFVDPYIRKRERNQKAINQNFLYMALPSA